MTQDTVDTLLTEQDVSRWLRISLAVLQRLRSSGDGPRFVQLSKRRIAYCKSDVEAWLAARTTDRVGGSIGRRPGRPSSDVVVTREGL
jgi:predicted DNA-binding transcriptional regulator AlpA